MAASTMDKKNDDCGPLQSGAATATTPLQVQAKAALRCPRCHSSNTKFCYYNNYSLGLLCPFCKTCRRYWTKGGALRNVPIGGGCRKNKKLKSSSSSRLPAAFDPSSPSPFVRGVVWSPLPPPPPSLASASSRPAFHRLWTSRSAPFPHSTAFPYPHTRRHHSRKPPLANSGTTHHPHPPFLLPPPLQVYYSAAPPPPWPTRNRQMAQ
ncbi:hypothetical protein SAY87_029324 [Trapa incisa]|uniref:Dof zinc finger protein n=1 Tax=Trapa incisa TaxID=236973 RepID=A0AAN7KE87_9MYRT|nr:hypothetical protein SAY87_029324 [Trapa incisa]